MMLSKQTKRRLSYFEEDYVNRVIPHLVEKLGKKNVHTVPRIDAVIVSVGFGNVLADKRDVESNISELMLITGRKPATSKSRKAIAAFKLREGQTIGAYVTLRGIAAGHFLEKLIYFVLPSLNNFTGFPQSSFDKEFNFSFGLKERLIFPEMTYDMIHKTGGLNVTFRIKGAKSKSEAIALLQAINFPIKS